MIDAMPAWMLFRPRRSLLAIPLRRLDYRPLRGIRIGWKRTDRRANEAAANAHRFSLLLLPPPPPLVHLLASIFWAGDDKKHSRAAAGEKWTPEFSAYASDGGGGEREREEKMNARMWAVRCFTAFLSRPVGTRCAD